MAAAPREETPWVAMRRVRSVDVKSARRRDSMRLRKRSRFSSARSSSSGGLLLLLVVVALAGDSSMVLLLKNYLLSCEEERGITSPPLSLECLSSNLYFRKSLYLP